MTEQEYADIAAACDRLLRSAGTSLARVGIPMLHLINEHPSCTAIYDYVLHPERPLRTARPLAAWEDRPRAALRAARAMLRSLLHENRPWLRLTYTGPVDVLIVSHLVNAQQLEREDDSYFGSLQRLLEEHGATSMLALINHLPRARAQEVHAQRATRFARMVLPDSAPAHIEAQLWWQCFRARSALRDAARSADGAIDRTVAMLASRQAWMASTVGNLRLNWSIAQVCRLFTPKVVLTTYEGEACERLIWHAARAGSPRPLCAGYQHARVLPRSHAIRRPVGVPAIQCDPDVILTLGSLSHEALARSPELSAVRLIKYGSHRRLANLPALPFEQRPQRCLVLPDADPYECLILFEFAIECALRLPALTFILRPHPGTRLELLPPLAQVMRKLPGNVTLSTGSTLEQDCASARYCLYRGSSAAMQAVAAGVKPFYLARPDELPFDPLAALPAWREVVSSPEDLAAKTLTTPADAGAAHAAADFCRRYTSDVRPAALQELLELITPGVAAAPPLPREGASHDATRRT